VITPAYILPSVSSTGRLRPETGSRFGNVGIYAEFRWRMSCNRDDRAFQSRPSKGCYQLVTGDSYRGRENPATPRRPATDELTCGSERRRRSSSCGAKPKPPVTLLCVLVAWRIIHPGSATWRGNLVPVPLHLAILSKAAQLSEDWLKPA